MARSIALSSGFAETYPLPSAPARVRKTFARKTFGRIIDWLGKLQQRGAERQIAQYLAERGYDHFTDSIERDIDQRFIARQPERF